MMAYNQGGSINIINNKYYNQNHIDEIRAGTSNGKYVLDVHMVSIDNPVTLKVASDEPSILSTAIFNPSGTITGEIEISGRVIGTHSTRWPIYFSNDVGIGTTTPSYSLDVTGTGRYTGNLLIGDPVGARTEINTSTNHKVYAPTNIKTVDIDGNYQGGGFVGVYRNDIQQRGAYLWAGKDNNGFSCGVDKFTLDGSYSHGASLTSYLDSGDSEALTGLQVNTTNGVVVIGSWIGYEKNKGFGLINKFKTKFENDLYVETGNVGIGTTTPDSKLTVAGNIHAREVKVTVDAGADFVFNEDYKLPPLQEVSQFIKRNKHLPEIASEKEMQANGLHLAEMNIKLLQKIEELTLYTIEQEKKLKSQEETNIKLEQRLSKLENMLLENKN